MINEKHLKATLPTIIFIMKNILVLRFEEPEKIPKPVCRFSTTHQLYYSQNNCTHVCKVQFEYLYLTHFPIKNIIIYNILKSINVK